MIRDERLMRPDPGLGISAIVKPGNKAVTWQMTGAGLVQAGDYVDLLVMGPKDCPFVGRTLQAIRILAVDGELDGAAPDRSPRRRASTNLAAPRWLTLELTPYESTVVAAGMAYGSVVVQTRSTIDILQSDYAESAAPPCFPVPSPPTGS